MATYLSRELVFLILQFLDEEKFKETVHSLEQDSGFFFNMKYFEDEVHNGNWDVVERYLSGFTKVEDNRYSMKIFFEIRKQKYLEALDKHDHAKAIDILVNDLKVFESFNEELFKEITYLFTLENFRQNEQLSKYGDTQSARAIMLVELKKLIEANPLLQEKLQFPKLKSSRLRTLINQSLNWQHQLCKNPKPNPNIQTLFVDHSCGFGAPTNSAAMVQSRTAMTTNFPADYPSSEEDPEYERKQAVNFSEDNHPITISSVTYARNPRQVSHTPDDLPRTVARILSQGSTPVSMDFHPIQHTILLVGTSVGDIGLWDIGSREKLVLKHFSVWKLKACSVSLQSTLAKDPGVSVNRILWSPDGSLFGVAYSLCIVQIHSYHGGGDIRQHLEIDAHVGGVNDIAFASPNKHLCVITCGEDKTIKVWDANTGTKQFTFEGHEASVYSVCPHSKENIPFIFSTGLDGKIKAWLYDVLGSRVDYDAPGHSCTTMAYSADGSRLFSCGTSKDGVSYIVEWNEREGAIQGAYSGLNKRSLGVVQFDTTRNLLAVGDEFLIKFWDMDNTQLLTSIDADGGLPASPRIRFNKEGSLLAVSTNDNGIKILANSDGLCLLRKFENRSSESFRTVLENMAKPSVSLLSVAAGATSSVITESDTPEIAIPGMNADSRNLLDVKPRSVNESIDKTKIWKFTEISESAQCRSLRLSDNLTTSRISRLVYTNSGVAILALASNAVHLLWKWPHNHRNPTGKATTNISPQLWQPASGILMMNETTDTNPEEVVPCVALSKNDSYVMSASGGKISLFNMMTFKRITTFMPPAPAATFLAFHPQDNNIVAIGMDDSTIHIYNVPVNVLKMRLRGHSSRITGLTFSNVLNVLVSSGADTEICVWGSDEWEKIISKSLINLCGHKPTSSDTHVQFHQDQIHFLAVNEGQLDIYDATKLECLRQWVLPEGSTPISHATFSCDGQLIYVSFVDATVCVFSSTNLIIQCRINPAAYLPANISSNVYPVVVAAHPSDPNQFALGLTDGAINILEPLVSEGRWGAPSPF